MLILSDLVDFESSVRYFNNYKLVMSQCSSIRFGFVLHSNFHSDFSFTIICLR